MYKIIRSFLFLFEPESVHFFSMNALRFFSGIPVISHILKASFKPASKPDTTMCGLTFKNQVGLGAGFDKNAMFLKELEMIGFGFIEIGTVTPIAQKGNDKPRLFRLPEDNALINRMGFNNNGVAAISERLKEWRSENKTTEIIIGGNIGKNKQTANEDAWKDYLTCFNMLHPYVDYFVVNVSSPNTPGLRELQDKDSLHKILTTLQTANKNFPTLRPIFLKVAPDLTNEQIDQVVSLALEIGLDGLIIANTTINRSGLKTNDEKLNKIGTGGLSGKPIAERSTEMIHYVRERSGGKINIIASGGIFTAKDAREKLDAGATLIQVWTGFIYEGPSIVKNISNRL